ncbi:hypothetical protein [Cognatishimia sp. MH4019]|uniref:hypothetical protein n=1 Tax=Cognatishimia sp. MH4019 TaxID=2854030 RepID=UPI001CD36A69|nr:hypothetical protein [Cognatishimia sp. MH4019]
MMDGQFGEFETVPLGTRQAIEDLLRAADTLHEFGRYQCQPAELSQQYKSAAANLQKLVTMR